MVRMSSRTRAAAAAFSSNSSSGHCYNAAASPWALPAPSQPAAVTATACRTGQQQRQPQPPPDDAVAWLVEDDAAAFGAGDTHRKAFASACITLTLGVLGRCAAVLQGLSGERGARVWHTPERVHSSRSGDRSSFG